MKQTSVPSRLLIALVFIVLISACRHKNFPPVNVGREYGNPTMPWLVSHVPERNRWALTRTKHHNFFQMVLCHNPVCRTMIGRRKALNAISFEEYRRRIRKNAKKGLYKTTPKTPKPTPEKAKPTVPGNIILPKDSVSVTQVPAAPITESETQILKADSLITFNEVLFEINSAHLRPEHYSELDLLGAYLVQHPTLEVSVFGHTDDTGTERHNVSLSTRRAEAVAEYLVSKGVTDEKVFFEGFGSSQPIVGNDTPEGRGKNRRVEILIQNPKKK
jgi:outer membrane protein OmpA-like peptidoglycan-associated protein